MNSPDLIEANEGVQIGDLASPRDFYWVRKSPAGSLSPDHIGSMVHMLHHVYVAEGDTEPQHASKVS